MSALTALTSTTMEAGLLELIEGLADKQADEATNPNGVQMVTGYTRDGITGEVAISLTIPSTSSQDASGRPVIFATQVFS